MTGTHAERGRVNAHTHVYSGLAPFGMPTPTPPPTRFPEILERVWWRLDRALDEASLRASARYYVAESLLAGTSTLVDHHESPGFIDGSLDVIAEACRELGMRAILCFGATERNGGREEARRGLAECRRFIAGNTCALVRGVVGLHASFTVSDDTIAEAAALCRELDTVMHVHLAEDECDVTDARARGYDGPLERLLAFDALPPGSIVAHGVHLGAAEVRRLAEREVWIVQNPRSNRGNGVGYPRALTASARVALGTDGYPSDLHAEAGVLVELASAAGEPAAEVAARVHAGHRLVAQRFGSEATEGGTGAEGDDVTTVADEAVFDAPPDPAVGLAPGPVVRLSISGREVVADGRLITGNADAIRRDAVREAGRLWRRMRSLQT